MVEIRELRYLLAAAESRSIRRAADAMGAQQSTLSRAIRNIEEELGVPLFERRHNGIFATSAGVIFLEKSKKILESLDCAIHEASLAGRGIPDHLRIGIHSSLGRGFLRNFLKIYYTEHPEVHLDIFDGLDADFLNLVASGVLDITFTSKRKTPNSCDSAKLWKEAVFVAMAKDHALSHHESLDWSDLLNEQILVSVASPGPEVETYICDSAPEGGGQLKIDHVNSTQETLLDLVSLGKGITLVVSSWHRENSSDLSFIPLAGKNNFVIFNATWRRDNKNFALQKLINILHLSA
ncbi:hypothetical protein BMI90_07030 [Thioclava sp. L04-15]|uniref:LysR family transcriptional regulator n=1 Tax=Thioclava sp. L04-15 TaxID=1915318 RepID=UPI0009969AAB|nr:LysR family transcriptional regulator [Thioclava sp. L04-15]OOY28422.1 hypothetical protein BMI90_07030 [Thioclava sp. L04-15]